MICLWCAQVHRTSPDFPDALCELLFALQEGRRLNDQRCSFRLEHRRRCYSEPSTPRQSQRGEETNWTHFIIIVIENNTHCVFPNSGVLLHDIPAEGGVLRFVGDFSGSSTGWPASRTPGRSLCPPTSAAQDQAEEEQLEDPRGHPNRSHANAQRGLIQHDRQFTSEWCWDDVYRYWNRHIWPSL